MSVAEERRMNKSDVAEMMVGKEDACGSRPIDFAPKYSITFTNMSYYTENYNFVNTSYMCFCTFYQLFLILYSI